MKRRLYLIRHAHALDDEDDASRPLSPRGAEVARRLAAALRIAPDIAQAAFWHSPLLRSRQTAGLLAGGLALPASALQLAQGLLPDDDPRALAGRLARAEGDIAIVGHEPQLGALAEWLVFGKPAPEAFRFRKGAALCLGSRGDRPRDFGEGCWSVQWMLSPDLLPASGAPRRAASSQVPR